MEDAGRGKRVVIASPIPTRIVELPAVKVLAAAGFVVITVGGGGIPVARDAAGNLHGVPAVIDKDFASSLLASELEADLFVIATAVERVALDFGKPEQRWVDTLDARRGEAVSRRGNPFRRGEHGAQDRGLHLVSRARRSRGDHHRPAAPPPGRPRPGGDPHRPGGAIGMTAAVRDGRATRLSIQLC